MAPSAGASSETPDDTQTKVLAISALLEDAERRGFALSPPVQKVVEQQCISLFDYEKDPAKAVAFSHTLKETAVRLFRQRRYREADARYKLAAKFNPTDPTLVSNRATCMYNMAKYRKCIDLCLDCVNLFPNLCFDNTMLYFKVLLRMGRANIELENFAGANATFDALSNMRNGFNSSFGIQIPEEQFTMLLVPFEKHLKAKMDYFEQHGSKDGATPFNPTNKDAHDDDEDDDDPEGEDDNLYGNIQLDDLCPHVYEDGRAVCHHPFPGGHRNQAFTSRNHDDEYGEPDLADSAHSDDGSIPSLISSSHGDDDESADSDMPDLVSDEEDYSGSAKGDDDADDDDNSDADERMGRSKPVSVTPVRSSTRSPVTNVMSLKELSEQIAQRRARPSKAKVNPIDWTKLWIAPKSSTVALDASNASASSSIKEALDDGFKRGFLKAGSLLSEDTSTSGQSSRKTASSSSAGAAGSGSIPRPGYLATAVVGKRQKNYLKCYESDQEQGPLTTGLFHERSEEDDAVFLQEKTIKRNDNKNWACIGNVLREVMGKSFQTNRTVDFTRIFGHHVAASSNSKRKKKSCDKNCGTCFARKMWKMRFISAEFDQAEAALTSIETDSRREKQTFLSGDLWQGTGYYASGYEMAFDVPALVHGVAYMIHLQCELHWRGDKVTFLKDAQHSFIASLERNYRSHPNKEFLFMIFMLIRDTVNLFGLFPDPMVEGARRSFQFSKSATNIAEKVLPPNVGEGSEDSSKYQMLLASKSENLTRNVYNWSHLGQIAKEEEWIYDIMLRDVSHLITKVTSPVPKTPMYLEQGESFSEAFEKACGERSGDEKYWRCRVVTIVDRERCRMIERSASEAEDVGDTEKSAQLLSSAIACRPRQARLLLRKAQVRAQQKKWKDSLSDIGKGLSVVGEQYTTSSESLSCNPPPVCLKVDLYSLEADVLFEYGKENGINSVEKMKLAMESVSKALACHPKDKATNESLEERLDIAKWFLSNMEAMAPGKASLSQDKREKGTSSNTIGREPGDSKAAAKDTKGTHSKNETDLVASSSKDASAQASRGKKRKSKKPQPPVSAKPAPAPIQPENDSSSSEEEGESSLAGNPYAALLDDGRAPAPQNKGGIAPASSPASASAACEDLHQKAPRGYSYADTRGQTSASLSVTRKRAEASRSAIASGSQLECHLCGIGFSGKSDFDSHMKGRRHRTAVANASASGQTPAEWRARALSIQGSPGSSIEGSLATGFTIRPIRPQQSSYAAAADPSRSARSYVNGPTREEALAEVERAIAILGGEARPCDIIPRMRFLKWNIRDVNAYLENKFGGLLRLCLQNTQMFEIRPGTESRPVLVWIDPNIGPSSRANASSIAMASGHSATAAQRGSLNQTSGSTGRAGESSDLSRMLRDQLRVSGRIQRGDGAARDMDGPAECGICYDNVPDIRLMPCKHEWCTPCIAANIERGRNECPVCQQTIHHTEMVYELD